MLWTTCCEHMFHMGSVHHVDCHQCPIHKGSVYHVDCSQCVIGSVYYVGCVVNWSAIHMGSFHVDCALSTGV